MRAIGCLLMNSGWCIAAAALGMLTHLGQRYAFVGAGISVEILGIALLANSHREMEKGR